MADENYTALNASSQSKTFSADEVNGALTPKAIHVDDNGYVADVDSLSSSLITIDFPHHETHEGHSFATAAFDLSMGASDTLNIAFKTPNTTKTIHMLMDFITLTGATVIAIEAPTWTTNTGTLTPIVNRNRQGTPDSSVFLEDKTSTPTFTATDNVLVNVTGISGGTTLGTWIAFGSKGDFSGSGREEAEWILKADTTYVLKFTSDAASNKGELKMNWYEHTPSN